MTSEVFVVAYESDDDAGLLAYAIDRATKDGATLKIVHILEWSPYKFLTPQEIEERHTRRKQEMLRAQEIIIDPAVEKARKAGIEATGELRYGTVVEQIADIAARSSAATAGTGPG